MRSLPGLFPSAPVSTVCDEPVAAALRRILSPLCNGAAHVGIALATMLVFAIVCISLAAIALVRWPFVKKS